MKIFDTFTFFNESPEYLDSSTKVTFLVSGGRIVVCLHEGYLMIHENSMSSNGIAVMPQGGVNSIKVAVLSRNEEKTGPENFVGDKSLRNT